MIRLLLMLQLPVTFSLWSVADAAQEFSASTMIPGGLGKPIISAWTGSGLGGAAENQPWHFPLLMPLEIPDCLSQGHNQIVVLALLGLEFGPPLGGHRTPESLELVLQDRQE